MNYKISEYFKTLLFLFLAITVTNCSSSDENSDDKKPPIGNNEYTTTRATIIPVTINTIVSI